MDEIRREAEVYSNGALLRNLGAVPVSLELRRFSEVNYPADLGQLDPRASARLEIPPDAVAKPWQLGLTGGSGVEICRLPSGEGD